MADVTISSSSVDSTGLMNPTTTAATNANVYFVRNSGNILLLFENNGNSTKTITFDVTQRYAGVANVADPTITTPVRVAANNPSRTYVGPFSRAFNDTSGDIRFTVSANLTVTVLRL